MFKLGSYVKRHHVLIGAFFILLGCASYQSQLSQARNLLEGQQYEEAEKILQEKLQKANGDKLAYMLEYGIVLHQAGKYKESNEILKQAETLADQNDYTSVSREFGSLLLQEGVVQFKAETFEYLLINIYRALNYMMLKDYENAGVMGRRITEKITKLEIDEDSKKRQSSFAAYLAAMMWEAQNDPDNARIMYAKAYDLMPTLEILKRDLYIAAQRAQRNDLASKYKKQWPEVAKNYDWKNLKTKGEIIFIYQQGWVPFKRARPENHRFPMMVRQPSQFSIASLVVDDKPSQQTEKVYDLEQISEQTLDADFARLLTKKVAGIAAKATLAHQLNKKNQGLGDLVFLALDAADQADLRQWSTLPASFQVAREYVNPGKHHVKIHAVGRAGEAIIWEGDVDVKKGQKTFITHRTF